MVSCRSVLRGRFPGPALSACLLFVGLGLGGCADPHAPVVEAAPLSDTRDSLGPYTATVLVTEHRGLHAVRLYHRDAGADRAEVLDMTEILPGRFEAAIPGRPAGTRVHWFVEAEDVSGNLGYDPPEAELGDRHCRDRVDPEAPPTDGGLAHCFTILQN